MIHGEYGDDDIMKTPSLSFCSIEVSHLNVGISGQFGRTCSLGKYTLSCQAAKVGMSYKMKDGHVQEWKSSVPVRPLNDHFIPNLSFGHTTTHLSSIIRGDLASYNEIGDSPVKVTE